MYADFPHSSAPEPLVLDEYTGEVLRPFKGYLEPGSQPHSIPRSILRSGDAGPPTAKNPQSVAPSPRPPATPPPGTMPKSQVACLSPKGAAVALSPSAKWGAVALSPAPPPPPFPPPSHHSLPGQTVHPIYPGPQPPSLAEPMEPMELVPDVLDLTEAVEQPDVKSGCG